MLQLHYLFENFELAKECLNLYEPDLDSLDDFLNYFRISSNAVYPFKRKSDGVVCFLRLTPVEVKSGEEIAFEIKLINWLLEQQFSVMKPVMTKDDSYITDLSTKWGNYHVSCFEYVPGRDLEDVEGNLDLAYGYGAFLGQFHKLMKRLPFANERKDEVDLLKEIENHFVQHDAPSCLFTELESVRKELGLLEKTEENYGLVHYDFEADNVFYSKKLNMFSLIDVDDCIRCWYALDVKRAMDCLDDVVGEELVVEAEVKFLEGYRSVTDFTNEQEASLVLMGRLVCLQEYATLIHVLSDEVEDKPEWMVSMIENLSYRLHQIEDSLK